MPGDVGAVRLAKDQDPSYHGRSLVTDGVDAAKEEIEPALPISLVPHGLESIVVFLAMAPEEVRQIEDGLAQDLPLAQEKGDQEPTDPTVAVQKRVDSLELGVCESDPHEEREVTGGVKESLEIAERFGNDVMGRGHERRVGEGAASGSDPVLTAA
jgi:hypothetical protein